jgi:glucose-6-phosphate 1-epimerase
VIEDKQGKRQIVVAKSHSKTTIVWNPWDVLSAGMSDMEPEGWKGMICIESANAGTDSVTLAKGEAHTMQAVVFVGPIEGAKA